MLRRFLLQLIASIILGFASIGVGLITFDPMFWIVLFLLYNVCEIIMLLRKEKG
ncbi:MAG: hypothetical protein AB2421_16700 [Thermotaleaceae bacterium]